ncbi:junctional sarcoplasmic reticulum protein 1 [Syngnathus acus]|uniref:junctional sarcoplasmic reticulum protein 1 n=1 Tax=Syngnathus acus TaxID=161584 RepID=UPI0018864422|nr:junctional sarcoplasmic reticulum protein 1 [Syngnathus acus]
MEESYETFEEELGLTREDPPPQKPVRQIRRPEMYASGKVREETSAVLQPPKVEPTLPMESTPPKKFPVQKTLSMQNLSQIETPWENVTLNRCLFVAISILVLTSGFQRLHETLRSRGIAEEEEEADLTVRQPTTLRHRGKPPQPETTLWEVLFWWLPDLDDDDEDDEKRTRREAQSSRGLRNKPIPDKKLMKKSEGTLKTRRARKVREQEAKNKKRKEDMPKTSDEDEQKVGKEDAVSNTD